MNRQEIVTKIQNKINKFYKNNVCTENERQLLNEIFDEVEILRQPISLADFLGWEEDVIYVDTEYPEYIYKIKNNTLYEIIGQSLVIDSVYCFSKFSIEELRKFKKL